MSQSFVVDAILFDMDGTLVDSTPAVEITYKQFAAEHNFVMSKHPHGIRTQDNMRTWFPDASPEKIAALVIEFEQQIVDNAQRLEAEGKTGLIVLPGVRRILDEIASKPEGGKTYAICTSATRVYASSALTTTKIPFPPHFITAEDCEHGKPHPEPYLNGAKALGKDISRCLVVEDAPSGIASGLEAGATVLAVCTSHTRAELQDLGAHHLVDDLSKVQVQWTDEQRLRITIE